MRGMTGFIVECRVRSHLAITAAARPLFGRGQQATSVSNTSDVCIDVPCLDVSDGTGVTSVSVSSCANLDKSRKRAVLPLGDENLRVGSGAELSHSWS